MKKLEVRHTRRPGESRQVGVLAEERGRVFFEYAPGFLATGLNLSPFRLPERAGVSKREATSIIKAVQTAVARWQDFAVQTGISKTSMQEVAASLSG
ncbi:MAG: hypothetical protein AB1634_15170 [Thermodesulfobacteriota bacterium]